MEMLNSILNSLNIEASTLRRTKIGRRSRPNFITVTVGSLFQRSTVTRVPQMVMKRELGLVASCQLLYLYQSTCSNPTAITGDKFHHSHCQINERYLRRNLELLLFKSKG